MSKKKNGAYYTPEHLATFMARYVASNFSSEKAISVLEPSVGDGSFVNAFNSTCFPNSIVKVLFTGIEKINSELKKSKVRSRVNTKENCRYEFKNIDFLKYQINVRSKFDLIIGNPPYIKKGLLAKHQRLLCESIHSSADLPVTTVKNIWSSFLVRSAQLLKENGILAFVLPADLLQVKFSADLRKFLSLHFDRIEVFTFDDLLFECKGQDTVLLFGFKKHRQKGQYYSHISNIDQLVNGNFILRENKALVDANIKWSHHLLSADELTFIHKVGERLKTVADFCESKPGIVSAANDFFIVTEEIERQYCLAKFTKPIIQKGVYVNGGVVFGNDDYNQLTTDGKPNKIVCFSDDDINRFGKRVNEYLQLGLDLNLNKRYKCKLRNNWFVIPNISTMPQGFFFKRSHFYPKLLKNNANVLVTDSAYKIEMKDEYDIDSLIYSFYNSLTLAFAELSGRYYGGGVLELTPSEFKGLPIPYTKITKRDFASYSKSFEKKNTILEILEANDNHILHNALQLTNQEIICIKDICRKLIDKRFRKKSNLLG